jgi:predicted small metal-binding protein
MKQFACGDVVPGCQSTWQLPTEEEILEQVADHARRDHGMESVPDEVVEAVRAKITTV